jgi:hypothetical protein
MQRHLVDEERLFIRPVILAEYSSLRAACQTRQSAPADQDQKRYQSSFEGRQAARGTIEDVLDGPMTQAHAERIAKRFLHALLRQRLVLVEIDNLRLHPRPILRRLH